MKELLRNFKLGRLPKSHIAIDSLLIIFSLYFSLWLRLGWDGLHTHIDAFHRFVPLFLLSRLLVFIGSGVYRAMWRYISSSDAFILARATLFSSLIFTAISYMFFHFGIVPRSIFFIDMFCVTSLMMGARLLRRFLYEKANNKAGLNIGGVLIFGAGTRGRNFAQRLTMETQLGLKVIGFIDDDKEKQGRLIAGKQVLGTREDLEALLEKTEPTHLVIAIRDLSGEHLREIVAVARKFNIKPQVISEQGIQNSGKGSLSPYRSVELSDLLNRRPTEINLASVQKLIKGRRVLVTGAGGSIGSELARQIFRLGPEKLLLCDHSEYNLYEIDNELRLSTNETDKVIPLLLDIKDRRGLAQVFVDYRPQLVFHAAAYKHVHLVEANGVSAILNNVEGTKNILELSNTPDLEAFVLISTDKAVNPVGIMGSTKRVCELLTSSMGLKTGKLYCSVRFGNVLGSSGSLIPLLKKQIEDGGPVTITHADITRFFMLIPEAVSLVLMSTTLSKPGDISVLKMGEPIRIYDLAKSMIALMGRTEDEIPIVLTGLRPGEKMFEELYLSGKEIQTKHPDILTLPDGDLGPQPSRENWSHLEGQTEQLIKLALTGNTEALSLLKQLARNPLPKTAEQARL